MTTKKAKTKKSKTKVKSSAPTDPVEKLVQAHSEYAEALEPVVPESIQAVDPVPAQAPEPERMSAQIVLDDLAALRAQVAQLQQQAQVSIPPPPEHQDGEGFTRGLVTLPTSKDPSRSQKPDVLSSDGHGGVHRNPAIGGRGVPKFAGVPRPVVVDSPKAPQLTYTGPVVVDSPEPKGYPDPIRRIKVVLTIEASMRAIGPGKVVHWERVQEPTFWNGLLSRTGTPKYGDPTLVCRGVQLDDEALEELLG